MNMAVTNKDFVLGEYLIGGPGSCTEGLITESNVFIKYNDWVGSVEVETMKFTRKECPEIPVPEVFSAWPGISYCLERVLVLNGQRWGHVREAARNYKP